MLTDEEEWILRTRIAGWTRVQQAMEKNKSVRSIDEAIKLIKKKYDNVQPFYPILPPRIKKSVKNK